MNILSLSMGLLVLAGVGSSAVAQDYAIDWSSMDGGGGASTGGGYSLSGTIGQPDAGTMTGGSYTVTGGFWSIEEPSPSPRLFIANSGLTALISWSPHAPGFVLQANTGLLGSGWSDALSGSTNPVSIEITPGTRFFRLRK